MLGLPGRDSGNIENDPGKKVKVSVYNLAGRNPLETRRVVDFELTDLGREGRFDLIIFFEQIFCLQERFKNGDKIV